MYSFKRNKSIRPATRGVRGNPLSGLPAFTLEYVLLIVCVIIFLVRAVGVINSYNEKGGYAYVQMLNIGMPIVETQVYNEGAYVENKLSVKRVVVESLGLANVNLVGIVGNEVSYFNGIQVDNKVDNQVVSKHNSDFEEFKVNDNTIAKLTPEEIAELNDVSKAYKPSLKKTLNSDKPQVLIYHTHTMEQYSESSAQTVNNDVNVVGVGEILVKELEEGYGISVVHDKTNYTIADYNTAYDRSREGLQKYIDEYNDFELVIDLHRDSVPKESATAALNDQSLSKFMFVTAQNNANYAENEKVVNDLYKIGNDLFPELIKPTRIFPSGYNGFNQEFSDGSMIIEVGSYTNTAQEAKLTAKYIARIIAEYLNVER